MKTPNRQHQGHHPNRLLPFVSWMREVSLSTLRMDLVAGLTVAVVVIPQAMAYAMLAGLPPQYGLYAAAVTPAIAALWGSLRQLATGPNAIMSLLVFTTLTPHAQAGTERYIELAFTLSLLVGTIYLVVGLLRMGFIMAFISHATVKGFSSAVALIIISTQLPHLLGVTVSRHEDGYGFLVELLSRLPYTHPLTLAVGLASFALIHGLKRTWHHFPAALVALVLATLAVHYFGLADKGVAILGAVPAGMPGFHLPRLELDLMAPLLGSAIVIALVSFAETYAVGKTISEQTKQKVDVNQEFIGQSLANLVGAFFQCYPVSGSFARTAMGYAAGARTGLAAVFTAAAVILALLFLTPLLASVPRAALAALVISAVVLLFHPREVFALWRKNRHDGVVAVAVFALTLMIKPDYALLIGVIISLVLFLWVSMHPRIVRMAWHPKHKAYLNAEPLDAPCCPQMTILRVDNAIYFANAEYTMEHILQKVDAFEEEVSAISDCTLRYLLLDFKGVGFIDITGVDELRILLDDLRTRNVELILISLHLPVRQVFASTGLLQELGEQHIFTSYHEAMESLQGHLDHDACCRECPYSETEEANPSCHGPLSGER